MLISVFAVALIGLMGARGAQAKPARWTEADVVRLAQAHAPEAVVERSRVQLAEAKAEAIGRPPDPRVSWMREELFPESGTNNEDVFTLTWPLDFSGRRVAERALARANLEDTRAQAVLSRRNTMVQILDTFYEAIAAAQRAQAAQTHINALKEVERVLGERHAAGHASGYAQARLRIEAELAQSHLVSRRREVDRARQRLVRLLGAESAPPTELPILRGDLKTQIPAATETLIEQAHQRHPAIRYTRRSQIAAAEAQDAADAAWIPSVDVTGGYKVARTTETEHGYVVGIGLSIPIFSRDRGLEGQATAHRNLAQARAQAIRRRLSQQIVEARTELVTAREELERFEKATTARIAKLLQGARVSYEEGHRPLLELLDVERAASDVRMRHIALALEAKRAETELRSLTTGWP